MFNIGRIRIIDVDGIVFGHKHWENGDEVDVISTTSDAMLVESRKQVGTYVITAEEMNCIEFVEGGEKMAPKKKVTVINKRKKYEEQVKALKLEQDYWLASLYDAMQAKDDAGRISANAELTRIHKELEALV